MLRNHVDVIACNMVVIVPVPQDGAGRVGKMLFARQGKKFDYDLKQVNMSFTFFNIHFQFIGPIIYVNNGNELKQKSYAVTVH
jgi:hypothetical protein